MTSSEANSEVNSEANSRAEGGDAISTPDATTRTQRKPRRFAPPASPMGAQHSQHSQHSLTSAQNITSAVGASTPAAFSEGELRAITTLEAALGHPFASRQLLLDALTHRSYAYEFAGPGVVSNERLEFLGDAALALICSHLLYQLYPDAPEGQLTQMRAALVRASTLAEFARRLPIGPWLRLGRGEDATGGRDRELLIASAFEATLGALYLDGGLEAIRAFLEPLLRAASTRVVAQRRMKDAKSLLQELAQGRLGVTPHYRLVREDGPAHERIFVVEALVGELVAGQGQGRSKQQAEQAAAQAALTDPGWVEAPDEQG